MPDFPALRADNVFKRYGEVLALAGVTLDVHVGACVGLVGESGSGKTTLLRSFNRMIEPDRGHISIGGSDARTLDPVGLRRRIGYVPQEGGLLPHWTVLRNAGTIPWLSGQGDPVSERNAADALELVGLDPLTLGARWPHELSGGQRQRVAIARAIAGSPPPSVLLLDEPFGALDAIVRAGLQKTFLHLRRELRLTAVLVTHDMREAFALCDTIGVFRHGCLEQLAEPSTLLAAPATQYVRELLAVAGVPGDHGR
ncbi:MAG: ATP-binding cassette domain-containing protein [Gemmatimonadota bacterium]